MKLLPEWRKASKMYNDENNEVKFGTVDCTVHKKLCQQVGKQNCFTYPLYQF
jgi:hypothetical protein